MSFGGLGMNSLSGMSPELSLIHLAKTFVLAMNWVFGFWVIYVFDV